MMLLSTSTPSLATCLAFLSTLVLAQNPTVTIDSGTYTGRTIGQTDQYLGIKYASAARFGVPTHFTGPPSSPHAITQSACPQFSSLNSTLGGNPNSTLPLDVFAPESAQTEDCLLVNVWTPKSGGDGTVMVFFPGGGFQSGWIGTAMHNGSSLASNHGIIVVSANYRLGVFGFPNSTEIPLGSRNIGFLDQRQALQWVQDNIKAFRGDHTKVTIFGQSAGGASVDELLLTAGGTSLFQAAIAQSGTSYLVSTNLALPSLTGNSSQSNWNLLASQLGCTATPKLQCMTKAKSLDIKKVVSQNNLGFNPIFDGGATVVVDQTMTRTEGRAAKVPLLMGTNFAEGYSFDFSIAKLDAGTKLLLAAIIALYGGGRNDRDDSAGLLTQLGFNCPARHETIDSASAGIPTYRYLYNASFPNLAWDGAFASHGVEVPMVFGTYPQDGATAQQRALSASLQRTWADFAKFPRGFASSASGWPAIVKGVRPDENQMAVWRNGGRSVSRFQDADTPSGTNGCNILDQFYGQVPGLISKNALKRLRFTE